MYERGSGCLIFDQNGERCPKAILIAVSGVGVRGQYERYHHYSRVLDANTRNVLDHKLEW